MGKTSRKKHTLPYRAPVVTGINKYSEIGNGSAVKMESRVQ